MAASNIPKWLLKSEEYRPKNDKERFLKKNILTLLSKLTILGLQSKSEIPNFFGISFFLIYELYVLFLISFAHHFFFPLFVLIFFLFYLCFKDGKEILKIVKPAFFIAGITILMVLPSVFWQGKIAFLLPLKVFLSVLSINILARYIPFHKITRSLAKIHIPNIFILINLVSI